jgi:tetratricopeptide (TPR) repeat protein
MDAADKAIALDKSNSQALDLKGFLQDPRDLVAQESLYKQALDARPLACGCEHHIYGGFLQNVGRLSEATDEYRRSTDVLALNPSSQAALADVLLQQGKADEAKAPIDATIHRRLWSGGQGHFQPAAEAAGAPEDGTRCWLRGHGERRR